MELLVCFLLAIVITGGRSASDIIHAAKGTTPPHLEKARLRAQQRATPVGTPQVLDGRPPKPRLRDYASVVWGDAMEDAIRHHDRVKAEKRTRTRPAVRQRLRRLGDLLIRPVGEPRPAAPVDPDSVVATDPAPMRLNDVMGGPSQTPGPPRPAPADAGPDPTPVARPAEQHNEPDGSQQPTQGDAMTQPASAAAATEVNNNESAREAFTAMQAAAKEAADALAVLEAAKAKMQAAANSLADGVDATAFDATATAAAHEAADVINVGDLAEWSEKFDVVDAAAANGLAALDKYRDAEDLVANEAVDGRTLEPTR